MDEMVLRSLARWPDVPDVYGWLSLDRRGQWRLRGERIGHPALRDFIGRNYAVDERGCWYFQNGPQRVYVQLAYAPWVVHWSGDRLLDQREVPFVPESTWQDDEGSVLVQGRGSVALVDDRDLLRYAEEADRLPRVAGAEVPARFGFTRDPTP